MKIKIGLLFGGNSVEHEVSIISALQAKESFNKEKYEIIPIYITKSNEMYVGEDIGNIEEYKNVKKLISKSQRVLLVKNEDKVELVKYPFKILGNGVYDYIDVAFPVVHGTNVEDGTLQGYLNMLNIPYVGCDVLSSAVGMDKYVMKTVLKDNKINVLECLVFTLKDYSNINDIKKKVMDKFEFPVIIKPIDLGSSIGIKKANNEEELSDAIDYAFTFAGKILIERAVVNLREINCAVLGDYEEAVCSECEEPIGSDEILSFSDKYLSGNSKSSKTSSHGKGMANLKRKLPADISKELKVKIQDMALETFKVLGCSGVARIDFILDGEDVYVNEINTIPGSLAFYLFEAKGKKYEEELDELINLALKRDREQKNITYTFDSNILQNVNIKGTKGKKV